MSNVADCAGFEFQRRDDLAVEILDDETLIWDAAEQAFHRLDATTSKVWNACADWTNGAVIVGAIADSGAAGPSGAEAELVTVLNGLAASHLVRARPAVDDGVSRVSDYSAAESRAH